MFVVEVEMQTALSGPPPGELHRCERVSHFVYGSRKGANSEKKKSEIKSMSFVSNVREGADTQSKTTSFND